MRTAQFSNLVSDLTVLNVPEGQSAASLLRDLRQRPDVLYAEPNYTRHISTTPNDPRLVEQWALGNGAGGIHAIEAWSITTGRSDIVIGVVDTGLDRSHPDLVSNVYRNTIECSFDGIDTDANSFVDDCYGANAITRTGDATDDNGHGTAMAGIIGAVGNNGMGIAGVSWNVKLLPCKALAADGKGSDADIIACFDYIAWWKDHGSNIVAICAAFGGPDKSQALEDAIAALRERGILLITAAGNDGNDTSLFPSYPASYISANVLSVAATNTSGTLAPFSNYGVTTVHLAAPGDQILTTGLNDGHTSISGTSPAAAHVAGMAALIAAAIPAVDWKQVRNVLLAGGDELGTATTITGHRANVMSSITCADTPLFAPILPARTRVVTTVEHGVTFSAYDLNCGDAAGPTSVDVSPGNIKITLQDEGASPDDVAADGLYSATWFPQAPGEYTFTFSNGYGGQVFVSPYQWQEESSAHRDLDAVNVTPISQTSTIPLPFPISFGGNAYSSVLFDSHGFLTFDARTTSAPHAALPTSRLQTVVAPWWSELVPASNEPMRWAVVGTAPQRELVFEWCSMKPATCTPESGVTFQTVFFEDSADIVFHYASATLGGDCDSHNYGATATIGLQPGPEIGVQYSHDTPSISDHATLRWHANLPANASPVITSVQPDHWAVDSSPVAVILRGSGFMPGSIVLWNGTPRITNYLSDGEIYILATASDLVAARQHQLTVFNAAPGGGTSSPASFTIHPPDFTLRTSQPTLTARSTEPSSISLTAEPAPVFRSELTFSCSGLPSNLRCSFTPATITLGTLPATVSVTVMPATLAKVETSKPRTSLARQFAIAVVLIGIVIGTRSRRPVALIAACALLTLTSCGGSGGQTPDTSILTPTVTTVSAPVVITASGGGIAHTLTVTLVYTK